MERAQSFVVDAVCGGGALDWEHKKMFEVLAVDEIQRLTVQEIENLEADRMKFNAFRVCEEVSFRLDGATGPGGYLRSYVTKELGELFFFDKEYLDNYLSKPINIVPGCYYYRKLQQFMGSHCRKGGTYIEYLKFECEGKMEPDVTFVKVMSGLAQPALLSLLQCQMKADYLNIIINMYEIHQHK